MYIVGARVVGQIVNRERDEREETREGTNSVTWGPLSHDCASIH